MPTRVSAAIPRRQLFMVATSCRTRASAPPSSGVGAVQVFLIVGRRLATPAVIASSSNCRTATIRDSSLIRSSAPLRPSRPFSTPSSNSRPSASRCRTICDVALGRIWVSSWIRAREIGPNRRTTCSTRCSSRSDFAWTLRFRSIGVTEDGKSRRAAAVNTFLTKTTRITSICAFNARHSCRF